MTITWIDPETRKTLSGESEVQTSLDGQEWHLIVVKGVNWAVPQGWPNNTAPICEESEPEAFEAIFG